MNRVCLPINVFLCTFFTLMILSSVSYAAHPLITDDAGTQGKGKFQVEVNGQYDYDEETVDGVTTKVTGSEVASIVTYGITDNVDVVLGLPYQWKKTRVDEEITSTESGIADPSIELKWRVYEKDGLRFALKPGITLPIGDDEKGLGTGRTTYHAYLITTKEIGRWAFHLNLGYRRNENKMNEKKDIWHVSAASEMKIIDQLKLVANIGMEKNPDKASKTDPAFILGGIIYSITDAFDIDFGLKAGLNKPETDCSILAGTTFRF